MDFVLLHGTTQSPDGWSPVANRLAEHGHRTVSVDFPIDEPDLTSADYATIAADQAPDLDRPIAVAHSAAGLLLPAVAEKLNARHLVWLGALIPDVLGGRTLLEQIETDQAAMFTSEWATWDDSVTEAPAISSYFLFHDCDLTTLRWALTTLRHFPPRAVFAERPRAGRPAPPSTVVVPGHDRTLRPEWMRSAARERLGTEPVEIPGGHCPHVSRPDAIAELLVGLT